MNDLLEKPLFGNDFPSHLRGPALRTFFNICVAWELTEGETSRLLGGVPLVALDAWREGIYTNVPDEIMERIGHVLGVYRALHTIFHEPGRADGWLKRPNSAPLFSNRHAMELLLDGDIEGLCSIRKYLDAQLN